MKGPRQVGRDVLRLDAEPSARDVPGLDDLPHDLAGGLGWDGKTDTQGTASRFRIDGGVDATQLPGGIAQGAAGIDRVDRRVGLDEVLVAVKSQTIAPLCRPNPKSDEHPS